jgi:hypothetical protein
MLPMAVSYILSATKNVINFDNQNQPITIVRIKCFQAPYGTGVLFVKG